MTSCFENLKGFSVMQRTWRRPYAAGSNPFPSTMTSNLLEELDTIGEDTDREIIEIFLSYAWEITDKLRRLSDKIKQGTADRSDMEAAADLIKSIRSSSSYMDYQNLAAFLDAWHESRSGARREWTRSLPRI